MNTEPTPTLAVVAPAASCSRLLPPPMQTAMVFAARYTHHRNTGGTLAVCRALAWCWDQLDEQTQKPILDESHEATCNRDDWERFRGDDSPANAELFQRLLARYREERDADIASRMINAVPNIPPP